MNKQRTDFTLPLNHYNISKYWLLGYVEGDASFYFSISNKSLIFSIVQKGNQALMLAIRDFLCSLIPTCRDREIQNNMTQDDKSWVKINSDKKGIYSLIVQRKNYLEFVLIPLFDTPAR